ncbi:MAG: GNAT family N-acetyltransferase [Spirillospora sp.]
MRIGAELRRQRLHAKYAWSQSTNPWLVTTRSLVDTRVRPYISVLSTAGQEAPTIGYAGTWHGTVWILDVLEQRREASGAPTISRKQGTVSRSGLYGGKRALPRADLVAVGCAADDVGRLPTNAALVLPYRMHLIVDLSGSGSGEWRKAVSRRERQWFNARRNARDLLFEVVSDDDSFNFFYDRMHVPTMRLRHGERARSETKQSAYECLFRRGVLGFARIEGERSAGVLCRRDGDVLTVRLLGVRDGAKQHHDEGAMKILYHLMLEWADENGIRQVDFGAVEPWLSQGIFQWKRRFGPRIQLAPNHSGNLRVWWRSNRDTPAVRDFLVANPVFELTGAGDLRAVYFHDDERPPRLDLAHTCANNDNFRQIHLDEFLVGHSAPSTAEGKR